MNLPWQETIASLLYRLHLFRDVHFAENYFNALKAIANGDRQCIRRLHFAQNLLYYGTFHAILLWFLQARLSHLQNALLYNVFYLVGFSVHWNIALAVFSLLGPFLYELFYVRNVGLSAAVLYSILIADSNDAFLWKYRQSVRDVWKRAGGRQYRVGRQLQTNSQFIRGIAMVIRLVFQASHLFQILATLTIQLLTLQHLYSTTNTTNRWTHCLALVYFEFASCVSLAMMSAFSHIMILAIVFSILIIYIGHTMMVQFSAFVGCINSLPRLTRYQTHSVFATRMLCDVSRIYGTALFAVILIAVPARAMGVMVLALEDIWLPWRIVLITVGWLNSLVIFGFHFYGARMGVLIRRPIKKLIGLFVHSNEYRVEDGRIRAKLSKYIGCFGGAIPVLVAGGQFSLDTRTRFKLSGSIERFHSTNAPCFTYGKYGPVTYHSFGRELYYFLKILAFAYKILRAL